MANVKFDTELMINHVAATPAAAGKAFTTVLEPATRRPAVISLSNESPPVLGLIKEDLAGNRRVTNLVEKLNLPADKPVQAFVAEQDENLQIYLAIALKNGSSSDIYVCEPFKLDALNAIKMYPKQTMATVNELFMGAVTTPGSYPLLVADIQPPNRPSSKSSDLKAIWVDGSATQALQTFSLPENADKIISVSVASYSTMGKGLWILYQNGGKSRLLCKLSKSSQDGAAGNFNELQAWCDPQTTAIATYIDSTGRTGLLVGASDGLHHISAQDCIESDISEVPPLISRDSFLRAPKSISIAQDGPYLSVWGLSKDGQLGYITTNVATIAQEQKPGTELLGKQSSSSFSASISQPDVSAGLKTINQTVVSIDNDGHLTLLSQNRDSGIWRYEPFVIADRQRTIEVQSYSIRVTITGQNGLPVTNGQACIVASSDTTVYANGKTTNITSDNNGTLIPLDANGVVSIIVATNLISGRKFTITDIKDKEQKSILSKGSIQIDPSAKIVQVLCEKFANASDLTTLQTQSGKTLWDTKDNPAPSSSDLSAAKEIFKQMKDAHTDLSNTPTPNPTGVSKRSLNTLVDDIGHKLMDGFHAIKDAVNQATQWFVDKVKGVWVFICTIAGEVKKFVLNTIEKIGEAAQWVWNKIKLGWQKLCDFVGFLFSWDDIKNTSNDIYDLISGGCDYIQDNIGALETKVDAAFENLKLHVSSNSQQHQLTSSKTAQKGKNSSAADESKSSKFNYLNDRMKNGNPDDGLPQTTPDSGTVQPEFSKVMAPLGSAFQQMISDIAKTISDLFDGQGDISTADLFKKLGSTVINNAIDIIKSLVMGLLKLLKGTVGFLKDAVTGKIEIPIIGWLYKKCTGNDLDWLKLASFILGFMTVILTKLVTGKAPPRLQKPGKEFIAKMVAGQLSKTEQQSLTLFKTGIAMSVSAIKIVWDAISVVKSITKVGAAETALSKGTSGGFGIALGVSMLLIGFPSDDKVPGYELRKWTCYLTAASLGLDIAAKQGANGFNPAIDKGVATFKFATDIVNCCLFGVIFSKEIEATKQSWEDKDDDLSELGLSENILSTIRSCGTVVCMVLGESPPAAALGLAVMTGGAVGLTVNKGFTLNRTAAISPKCYRGALC